MSLFKNILTPFHPDIAVGVASTFNYYWLYDGCVEAGVPFYLGHAAYMKAIAGNKQKAHTFIACLHCDMITCVKIYQCAVA